MEVPLLLQFSIALFTGMVAATFVPPVRKSIPRPVEVILWIALVTVCLIGVMSITDRNVRELSASAVWGAEQVLNTIVGLMIGGAGQWLFDHRFAIVSWLVIVAGADILALMFFDSLRGRQAWEPRVRLREWMEFPMPPRATAGQGQAVVAEPRSLNRRLVGAAGLAASTALAKLNELSAPRETQPPAATAAFRRIESGARLDGLRNATAHLQFVASAWYAAAAEPALMGLASKARSARRAGHVIDIKALLNAQSIGWYGPFSTMPGPGMEEGVPEDAADAPRSDRMAS